MILTDKAKQEFILWYLKSEYNFAFDGLPNNLQNALIIEWFDSVGIYISINYVSLHTELIKDKGFQSLVCYGELSTMFRTLKNRQEATIKAIEKANNIFNNI